MKPIEIKEWKKLFPKVIRIENIKKLMDNEYLQFNRIDIIVGKINVRDSEPVDDIIHRLQLTHDIVLDVRPHDFYNEVNLNNLKTDKRVRKFTFKDAYKFVENVIEYCKGRAQQNIFKYILSLKSR